MDDRERILENEQTENEQIKEEILADLEQTNVRQKQDVQKPNLATRIKLLVQKSRITHNTSLKIMAFVFALLLWFIVVSVSNPMRTKVVYDVPVRLTGTSYLKDRGLAMTQTPDDLPKKVSVRIEVAQNDMSKVSAQNVVVVLDLSGIFTQGDQQVQLKVDQLPYGNVLSINTPSVTLGIEERITAPIPVQVKTTGAVQEGYWMDEMRAEPGVIAVHGAKSRVNQIATAVATVDISQENEDIKRSVPYIFVDEDGNAISGNGIEVEEQTSVIVESKVYPMKIVPVLLSESIDDQQIDGQKPRRSN